MGLLTCIFPALIDTLTLLMLCSAISERRFKPVLHRIFVAAFMIAGPGVLYLFYGFNPWLKPFGLLSWYLAVAYLYKGSTLYKVVITILHFNISVVNETVLLTILLSVRGGTIDALVQSTAAMFFLSIISRLLLLLLCLFLSRLLRRRQNQIELPIWEWLVVLLVSCYTFFELYPASIALQSGPTLLLPIRVLVLLFMNVSLVFLLDKLAGWYKIETEHVRLQEQMRYNRQSLRNASEAYQAQRRLTHDFNNRLLATLQLLEQGQSEEALTYVSSMLQGVARAETAVSTNHFIADAVLNQKYMQARSQGIDMQFIINDLSGFPLSADELVTVLANLLDNALEACSFCPADIKRSIKVKLLLDRTAATISVLNTSLPVSVSDNDIKTSKANSGEHGFGLKNIKQILQKNDFDFVMHYEKGWFQFTAIKVLL